MPTCFRFTYVKATSCFETFYTAVQLVWAASHEAESAAPHHGNSHGWTVAAHCGVREKSVHDFPDAGREVFPHGGEGTVLQRAAWMDGQEESTCVGRAGFWKYWS